MYIQSVYIITLLIITLLQPNCLDLFVIMNIWQGKYDEYCLKNIIYFVVRLGIKSIRYMYVVIWETRCTSPLPFSFVHAPAFIYFSVLSNQCNVLESNFKENLGIQDFLIHQKASNLVNSLLITICLHMQQVLMCGTCWGHYSNNDDFISSNLIGQIFLND